MKILLPTFMIPAAIGLFLSIIVHVSALLGMPCPFGDKTWTLHIGIFVVWFPAVLASQRLAKDFKRKDFWKATLRACPLWMKWMTYFFFAYAILNFIIFILTDVGGGGSSGSDGDTQSTVFRGFSGHWMAFYSASLAILYSADHVRKHDNIRRCQKGHPVSPSAKFCEECGGDVQEPEHRNEFPRRQTTNELRRRPKGRA